VREVPISSGELPRPAGSAVFRCPAERSLTKLVSQLPL